jgi:CRISPR-associated protein Cmr6
MSQVQGSIVDAEDKVPMMFRAQVYGRCQVHYANKEKMTGVKLDCYRWAEEWVEEASESIPKFGAEVQTRDAKISWRFVTNSGQDDGVIRPVIGGRGIPFYPGSSMKGVFRRSCRRLSPELVDRFCGDADALSPGILRFHGGYPTSDAWTENLVDIAHPQQNWQVQTTDTRRKDGSAFVQISLYQPELRFGISSGVALSEVEWDRVWEIWAAALSEGIGCRVAAGYGQPVEPVGVPLYQAKLRGQGIASTLLDGTPEFRPNMFRAALRGHALRIFGGLTGAEQAEGLVDTLFGGIRSKKEKVGLLRMAFTEQEPARFNQFGSYEMPYYRASGELRFYGTRSLPESEQVVLEVLVGKLMQFGMLLGGFGKSWRRSDHRLFGDDDYQKLIGCHWVWRMAPSQKTMPVRSLDDVAVFLDGVLETARAWMGVQGVAVGGATDWREAWVEDRAQVWGRVADGDGDVVAINWLHHPYVSGKGRRVQSIKQSSVTGKMSQVGRLWHRMFPVVEMGPHPKMPDKKVPIYSGKFLELLTFFPDESEESRQFEDFLNDGGSYFERIW